MHAWPRTFSSSRTLPGQECSDSSDLRAMRQPTNLLAVLRGEPGDEMPLQQRQVFLALRQARDLNLHHGKPVVQILAELLVGDGLAQIVIGGRDHAHVHLARASANPPAALPDSAARAAAWPAWRAACRRFRPGTACRRGRVRTEPALSLVAPVNEPLHVAEQFAFKQRLHHGGAVQHHVAAAASRAQPVQRLRHQILAGAGLAR